MRSLSNRNHQKEKETEFLKLKNTMRELKNQEIQSRLTMKKQSVTEKRGHLKLSTGAERGKKEWRKPT